MRKTSFFLLLLVIVSLSCIGGKEAKIDRYSLVTRHNIVTSAIDSLDVLSVGNGKFTFTTDITGLQTFPAFYSRGISLGTMAEWAWHSAPNSLGYSLDDVYRSYKVHGRDVGYVYQFRPSDDPKKAIETDWLRANPHKIHLGMIGLQIALKDGKEAAITDIKENIQKLNLWTGEIESTFTVEGVPVKVLTVCNPYSDLISAHIESPLISMGRLAVKISFPLGTSAPNGYDFNSPDKHLTMTLTDDPARTLLERRQDSDIYYVNIQHSDCRMKQKGPHVFVIEPDTKKSSVEIACSFSKAKEEISQASFLQSEEASAESWKSFWTTGGAVDFSQCTDPRAFELERRVILSRYLTRIQSSGALPPAETGLTYNSWFGKFHLEMHWWHSVHFALWQHEEILARQMEYYSRIIGNAEKTARHQGYLGARWPKMTDFDGRESPSNVGVYLIWQQPHPIFYAELLYLSAKDKKAILDKYSRIVFESADFMASYAWLDKERNRYVLGPVLIPAQESLNKETTINPPFEIVYWYWGLKTALEWQKRLGLPENEKWKDVMARISPLAIQNGIYLCSEDTRDSYTNPRYMSDHPIVSGINGVMPETPLVNDKVLGNTLDTIMKKWNWKTTWGWDYPMLAMSAAAIGRGGQAIDFLMMDAPKNHYLVNGHNYQDARLAIYLPGNGGLLTAIAKMCTQDQFPHNGKWKVKWENLNKYPE
jgi:protein-glucosylgalactosylhydroxylysine glucosidase